MGEINWPQPRHPGDVVETPGGRRDSVVGTVLRYPAGQTELVDQTVMETSGVAPHDWVATLPVLDTAPEPAVTSYRISADLEKAFHYVLHDLGRGLAGRIVDHARSAGYTVYVIGGPIRDLLLGRLDVNDLDLTGDMPSALFRDIACQSAIDVLPRERPELRHAWLPVLNVSPSSVVHGYRIIPTTAQQRRARLGWMTTEKFIEYAPFKQSLIPAEQSLVSGEPEFIYGWDPEADVIWRDVTINSLMYDPARRLILDPLGALDDFGLTQAAVRGWSGETIDTSRVTLRPIDIPAHAPSDWSPKAVGRVVKSMLKYPSSNLTGILAWIEANSAALQGIEANLSRLTIFLSNSVNADATDGSLHKAAKPAVEALVHAGAPEWFTDLLVRAAPAVTAARGSSPVDSQPRNVEWQAAAVSAINLVEGANGFTVGAPIANPAEGDPAKAADFFAQHFVGWRPVPVNMQGVDEPVEAFTDGTRYVAGIDGAGRIIQSDQHD